MTTNTKRRTPKKGTAADTTWHPVFLAELARTCNVSKAADVAGVGRRCAYDHKAASPEFAALWDDAIDEGIEALEYEARRRAIEGCERPIVSGGEILCTVRDYSDTLTIFLLKAHRPERYRDRATLEHSGPGGGPIPVEVDTANDRAARILALMVAAPVDNADSD